MPRILAAILLVAVLAIGGGIIATTAYQAGLSTAITTATGSAGTAVTPVVVPAYGYGYGPGWHPGFGFGFFGFLATLFFLFIVFALIRAIFWRGGPGRRGWGPGGWGGYGYGKGPDGSGHGPGRATPTRHSMNGIAVPTARRRRPSRATRRRPTGTA